jgi:hypothetical protein
MIVKEVVQSSTTKLFALAEFLLGQFRDSAAPKKISTKAFLDLAQNVTGDQFSVDQIKKLKDQAPLNNVIQDFSANGQEIYFKGAAEEPNKEMTVTKAQDIVARSAGRAARKRNK